MVLKIIRGRTLLNNFTKPENNKFTKLPSRILQADIAEKYQIKTATKTAGPKFIFSKTTEVHSILYLSETSQKYNDKTRQKKSNLPCNISEYNERKQADNKNIVTVLKNRRYLLPEIVFVLLFLILQTVTVITHFG